MYMFTTRMSGCHENLRRLNELKEFNEYDEDVAKNYRARYNRNLILLRNKQFYATDYEVFRNCIQLLKFTEFFSN